jgi:polysaccharide deacetylase 2 family uncharacterized protein YibQ
VESYRHDDYILLTRHNPGTIRLRIQRAFSLMPQAVGCNNHQGSKATADTAVMRVVLSEIKSLGKHFIDSRTTSESVALEIARQLNCPAASNHIFLDVEDDETYIHGQLDRMVELAKSRGTVIAIGHMRKKTLDVIKRTVPELEARGLRFVHTSQLIK